MKKVLLATTALVATAGFAAADITITGSANMGLKYQEDRASAAAAATDASVGKPAKAAVVDNNDNDTIIHTEIDFNIVASGTSDSGVEFGASVDLDASEADQRNGSDVGGGANDPEVYVSYNGLTVTVGAVGNAGIVLNTADVGFDGINTDYYTGALDDDTEGFFDMDVHVAYSVAGVTVAGSVGSDSEDMGLSVSGEFSGVSFGLGYADADEGVAVTTLGVGYAMGAIDVQANVAQWDVDGAEDEAMIYGLSAAYTSGAMTVTAAYSASDIDNTDAAYGIGVAYDLGGGLAVKAGIGRAPQGAIADGSISDAVTVADLGLTMSF